MFNAGPNGALLGFRIHDMRREHGKSDLHVDMAAEMKTCSVYQEGPDLVIQTYNRYWLDKALKLAAQRGYAPVILSDEVRDYNG